VQGCDALPAAHFPRPFSMVFVFFLRPDLSSFFNLREGTPSPSSGWTGRLWMIDFTPSLSILFPSGCRWWPLFLWALSPASGSAAPLACTPL